MTGTARGKTRATSFGAVAAAYERARPSYPEQAVDWLLPPGARRVLDVGAGTGKLTRALAARGLDVIAVEPSAGMREQLAGALPGVTVLAGTGEQIPLADGTVDAVLAAQAWHWVDPARAVPEVARVLRPGGQLGLLWNIRDERTDWVAELTRVIHTPDYTDNGSLDPMVGPPFGPVQRLDVEWSRPARPEDIVELVASRSYIITMTPPDREAALDRVRRLLASHPDTAGAAEISMPYVTRCSRARLD